MELNVVKSTLFSLAGAACATISTFFGGWDAGVKTLVVLMLADFLTGLAVALVWRKSPKTANGSASSKESLRGILRKTGMLVVVIVAVRLDMLMGGGTFVRDASVIALCLNEALSLVENLGTMGVPVPAPVTRAISALKSKSETAMDSSVTVRQDKTKEGK